MMLTVLESIGKDGCSEERGYENSRTYRQCIEIRLETSKTKPKLRAECLVSREELSILESCCLSPMRRNSVLEELRMSKLADIEDYVLRLIYR